MPLYPSAFRPPVIPLSTRSFYNPAPVVPPYVGPGDRVASALGWWGLRGYNAAVSNGTTKAVNLRRDSDNTTQDFVILSNGNLDVASITTFKSAANLFVTKIYDQTGNGLDIAQATAGLQFAFTLAGLGSLPIIQITSTTQKMLSATTLTQAAPFTISFAAQRVSFGTGFTAVLDGDVGNTPQAGFNSSANGIYEYSGGSPVSTAATDGSYYAIQAIFNGASSIITVNGTDNSVASSGNIGWSAGHVGIADQNNGGNTIDWLEAGVWGIAFNGTQRTNMNSNQRTYWGF